MGSITHAIHCLGTAVWWGGTFMGTLAMNPAVEVLDDPEERGKMVDEGWARFQPWAALGLTAALVTHIKIRRNPPRRPSSLYKNAALAKDLFMAGAFASSIASMALGEYAVQLDPDTYAPIETATTPSDDTPDDIATAQTGLTASSCVQLLTGAGLFITSAIMQAEREK